MIRSGSFAGRIAALLVMLLMTLGLTGCLSHWFLDSSTRLQVENRTKFDVVSIDIISEDHTSIKPWIKDRPASNQRLNRSAPAKRAEFMKKTGSVPSRRALFSLPQIRLKGMW